jgi:hypothetical protein
LRWRPFRMATEDSAGVEERPWKSQRVPQTSGRSTAPERSNSCVREYQLSARTPPLSIKQWTLFFNDASLTR